jgi:hypothetical protein
MLGVLAHDRCFEADMNDKRVLREVRALRQLREENSRLKRLVADCSATPISQACRSPASHQCWPVGVYSNPPSGLDREADVLEFLAAHPLP